MVCPEIFLNAESPMTMQIAMTGSDGALLASDKHWVRLVHHSDLDPSYDTRRDAKIKLSPDGKIAVSCSVDMIDAVAVADEIISKQAQITEGKEIESLREIIRPIIRQSEIQCLLLIASGTPKIFRILSERTSQGGDLRLDIHSAEGCITAGDLANSAKFWHQRYFDDFRSVDELCRLAALVIADASRMNRQYIGGLEIVVARDGKFSPIPAEECRKWLAQAEARSCAFADTVYSPFTETRRNWEFLCAKGE